MTLATERTQSPIESLARQTGFSPDAVAAMYRAIVAGGGGMAQFDHPEFGGAGQWMSGGMLMTSDPSDQALRARIAQLCDALARSAPGDDVERSFQTQRQSSGAGTSVGGGGSPAWPASYGSPDTSGSQDGIRYAWFGQARRLAIDEGGRVTVYDTGEHRIGGVAQQQGGGRSLTFTSQHGPVDVERLPVVDERDDAPRAEREGAPAAAAGRVDAPVPTPVERTTQASAGIDPFEALERLATLHARGILDDAEYRTKKAELLARI